MYIKKRYFLICIYLVSISLLSCQNNKSRNIDGAADSIVLHINISKIQKVKDVKNIIADIDFIPLETNDSSIISGIDKVIYSDKKYYVLDKRFQSLKVFDETGKYIRSIGSIGNGPGEYKELEDFIIDDKTKHIFLLDNGKQATHEFSEDGHYLKSLNSHLFASYFNIAGDAYYYHIDQNISAISRNYHLIIMNSSGKVLKRMFPFPRNFNYGISSSGFLIRNNEGMLYNSALDDTIYQIREMTAYPKYVFDFGLNKIPPEVQYSVQRFMKESISYSYLGNHISESANILMFSLFKKMRVVSAFCRSRKGNRPDTIAPKSLGFPIGYALGITKDDYFISSVSVPRLLIILNNNKGKLSKESIKRDYPDLYNMLPTLKKSANPILTVFKFKDDL